MLFGLPRSADRAVARQNAKAVAEILGTRAASRQGTLLGEPDCPYELRWNADPFWFGVRVSDDSYVATGNYKGAFDESAVPMQAMLKVPDDTWGIRLRLDAISQEIGVSVFVSEPKGGPRAAAALRSAECNAILRQIRFEPIRWFHLSPVQLYVVSDFVTPRQCAEQVTLLRGLILALRRWSTDARPGAAAP
jgi:hypothetical protein